MKADLMHQLGLEGLDQLTPEAQAQRQQAMEQQLLEETHQRRLRALERLEDPYLKSLYDSLYGRPAAADRVYASPGGQELLRCWLDSGKATLSPAAQQARANLREINRQCRAERDRLPDISTHDALYRPLGDILALPLRYQKGYVKKLVALSKWPKEGPRCYAPRTDDPR